MNSATESTQLRPAASMGRTGRELDLEAQSDCEKGEAFAVGQVTVRLPLDLQPLPLLALFLSFLPWAIPVLLLADVVLQRRMTSAYVLGVVLLTSVITECMLKPFIGEPRPATSACRSEDGKLLPGMPSGHVMVCQSALTFFLCMALHEQEAFTVVALALAMPSMPWARWYNGDHSMKQVIVTFILATIFGLIAYLAYWMIFQSHPSLGDGSGS
eukprot:TRINITY_DN64944_c0_g1_i1.p1 TRINITY_DN64944_c0_g1~~TRINITY_DN64944_c0_g1_i1.p1  ORF type:complete len:214 (+),score=41.77 TRINITY_DN64944_c0_g1_i1:126-767(+)